MREVAGTRVAVLRALERANRKHGRACQVSEIIAAMPPEDVRLLKDSYAKSVNMSVGYILTNLFEKGKVLSPGRAVTSRNYNYALPSLFDPRQGEVPFIPSRHARVLELVRGAAARYGRAVRVADICRYVDEQDYPWGLNPRQTSIVAQELVRLGELRTFPMAGDSKGSNLYLPPELDPAIYLPRQPSLKRDKVLDTFELLWQKELQEAKRAGRRPRPLSTTVIRERHENVSGPDARLKSRTGMGSMLCYLASTLKTGIRQVDRGEMYAILWAPIDVLDDELDIANAYASDAERMRCALRRACARHARPVTAEEVAHELAADEALSPSSKRRVGSVLHEAAKTQLDGRPRTDTRRMIRRLGHIGNDTYYWHDDDAGEPSARSYFSLLEIQHEWTELDTEQRLDNLDECRLPMSAIGQAKQLEAELSSLAGTAASLIAGGLLTTSGCVAAKDLSASIAATLERTRFWLSGRSTTHHMPSSVTVERTGWTAEELLRVIQPLYPTAQRVKQIHKIVSLLHDKILRRPNPIFTSRFSGDRFSAAESVFDRTDSLLFAARQWGGEEAFFQANIATVELGRLRDARFVLPVLQDADFERRLMAVACLAFLSPTTDIINALRRASVDDADFNVRAAAVWAHRLVTSDHDDLTDVLMG